MMMTTEPWLCCRCLFVFAFNRQFAHKQGPQTTSLSDYETAMALAMDGPRIVVADWFVCYVIVIAICDLRIMDSNCSFGLCNHRLYLRVSFQVRICVCVCVLMCDNIKRKEKRK